MLLDLREKNLRLYQSLYLLIPCLAIYGLALIFYFIQSIKVGEKQYYLLNIFPKLYYIVPFVGFSLLISILIIVYTFKKINDNNISKVICVKSFVKNRYLIIEISNSTIEKLQYVGNNIVTTKQDKHNHGIGIANIKTVISKYNGTIDIVEEKNKFIINIMFKIE